MANNTYATMGDIRMTSMVSAEINLLLKDTANLRNTGLIQYAGSVNSLGTDSIKIRKIGLMGRDSFESRTEVQPASETSITDDAVTLTVARYSLMYNISDLLNMTATNARYEPDPFALAASMAGSYDKLFAELTAAAAAGVATGTSTTGTTMSVSTLVEGIYDLERADSEIGAPGPFYACLHPKSLTELQASLRAEQNNIISQMMATEAMIAAKGLGYAGKIFGVDIYRSSHIETDGTDYENFIADAGALAYADGVPQILGAAETMEMDKVVVELERTGASALTSVIGHAYLTVGVVDSNRITRLLAVD
jgi:hypothetical protein